MKLIKILCVVALFLGWSTSASAFKNSDIFEAIISAHQDKSRPDGMDYISKVEQVPGTYNTWTMLFRVKIKDANTGEKKVIGLPTTIRYAGNVLYIKHRSADVDRRVLDAVLDDVAGSVEDLKNYNSGDLKGFRSNIGHNGKTIFLEGSVNISGKRMDEVRDLLVELRSELADFYEDLYEANVDALEDYFDDVLDRRYTQVMDTQTFVEIIGHDFTVKNQEKRRVSDKGHWSWKEGNAALETINFGDKFEEIILLPVGMGLSEYKTEKMYDELQRRIKTRLPKGAKSVEIIPHPHRSGVIMVVLSYPYSRKTDGEDIREYHDKFIAYTTSIYPDLEKIIEPYVQAPEKQKIHSLTAKEFMALIDDGLESLPIHEANGARGQWKFKYKGIAYIITNHKRYMTLSFIYTLPHRGLFDGAIDLLEEEIDYNYPRFADKYDVGAYKSSDRTVMVNMRINYGVLSSQQVTGKKIKAKYDFFTQTLTPDLNTKLKAWVNR